MILTTVDIATYMILITSLQKLAHAINRDFFSFKNGKISAEKV